MPSSYTPSLRLTQQAPGENSNSWGTILNNGVFALAEQAIAGATPINVSGAVTLTAVNGAADQSRAMALVCIGSGGTITVPGVAKLYLVDASSATGAVTISTGGGANAVVEAGNRMWVYCPDGLNYELVRDTYLVASIMIAQAAAIAAAKTYTDQQAFATQSGSFPGQPGSAGKVLQTDGTNIKWGPEHWWQTVASGSTLALDTPHLADTRTAAQALSLPALSTAKAGQRVSVRDRYGLASVRNITIAPQAGDHVADASGNVDPIIMDQSHETREFVADPANGVWSIG